LEITSSITPRLVVDDLPGFALAFFQAKKPTKAKQQLGGYHYQQRESVEVGPLRGEIGH